MRRPGFEPGTTAWKAIMLTPTPSALLRGDLVTLYVNISTGGASWPHVYGDFECLLMDCADGLFWLNSVVVGGRWRLFWCCLVDGLSWNEFV